ncbi:MULTISPECIES: hypothetical protein [Thalassospira]|nr:MULTISPECIES: hypothetical protein [Thalassospira]
MCSYEIDHTLETNLNALHDYKAEAEGKKDTTNYGDECATYYTSG